MTIFIKEGTVLPERRPYDLYETPAGRAWDGVTVVVEDLVRSGDDLGPNLRILDPGAGAGIWGSCCRNLWPNAWIAGVELREVRPAGAYDQWVIGEFNEFSITDPAPGTWDLVIGNPPYRESESFIRVGLHYLRSGGRLLFLLRLAFLEGQRRGDGLWRELPPKRVDVCKARTSFSGDGKSNATAYGLYLWEKGFEGETTLGWR